MVTNEQFHIIFSKLGFPSSFESFLFKVYNSSFKILLERSNNNPKVFYNENLILDYVIQEFRYLSNGRSEGEMLTLINDDNWATNLVLVVSDKVLFNEIIPYQDRSFISHQSPIISTMELNINFILDRIKAIKRDDDKPNVVLDMYRKAFLMFKSVNYLLTTSFETEAFATWRTIHEMECIIKALETYDNIVPVYYKHMTYNDAFRDSFKDKDAQQKVIDDLKANMHLHDLKSKDMKKYIEYGWMYAIKDVETRFPGFKLNFRNGLEVVAGLSSYSKDYEMASEVAHSSPILVYSNRLFFRYITVVRSYESFLRLEDLFYNFLMKNTQVDNASYTAMRKRYRKMVEDVLRVESNELNKYIISIHKN